MLYETVFDLQERPFDAGVVALPALLSTVGLLALIAACSNLRRVYRIGSVSWKHVYPAVFMFFWVGFATLATIVVWTSSFSRYRYLQQRIGDGQVELIEGVVENFDPMPHSGRGYETFCVADTCFQYSDLDLTEGGFNNTSSHGGPIRAGLQVRVTHVGNTIVRLQVARQHQ